MVYNLITAFSFIHAIAFFEPIIALVKKLIGQNATPLKAIIIDKTTKNNWGLDWHQDLKIALKTRVESHGFTNWSTEFGISHVVPTIEILKKIINS